MIVVKIILLVIGVLALVASYNIPKNSEDPEDKKPEKSYNVSGHLYLKTYLNLSIFCFVIFYFIGGFSDQKKNETSNESITSSVLHIGEKYYFFDANNELECQECDRCWCIIFNDVSHAEMWSEPCSKSSLKSCTSNVTYRFDRNTNTVTILNIDNGNVTAGCKSRFKGEWTFSEGKFGKRFYSKSHPGCDFNNSNY